MLPRESQHIKANNNLRTSLDRFRSCNPSWRVPGNRIIARLHADTQEAGDSSWPIRWKKSIKIVKSHWKNGSEYGKSRWKNVSLHQN